MRRILAQSRKELTQIVRDWRTLTLALILPVVLLMLLSAGLSLTVNNLPPYCPELNATERLWHHTRITGTHNRYFVTQNELKGTLVAVFKGIQAHPEQIRGYLNPFC